ncbi:MAG: hypothetical protein Hyperionvirus2_76 [Hyperionvirus sp.]|uniref:Uncharacterized protein n=1 Tax=Hyperionvirus sp. TaxID=2487770 RepID=A0A3G5A6A8_9VIRU|nr:MAG: hypothetical protein Hyperionvirus2_76 [Hyperionvirus sp.]
MVLIFVMCDKIVIVPINRRISILRAINSPCCFIRESSVKRYVVVLIVMKIMVDNNV